MPAAAAEEEALALARAILRRADTHVVEPPCAPPEDGEPPAADETGYLAEGIKRPLVPVLDAEDAESVRSRPAEQANRAYWTRQLGHTEIIYFDAAQGNTTPRDWAVIARHGARLSQ